MRDVGDLCETHGYPAELGRLLEEVSRLAEELLSPLTGLVLSPSVSTGDFLWRRENGGGVRFLSDIDGFVFTDAPTEAQVRFRREIKSLSHGRGGPLFSIDLSLNPTRALRQLPETLQMVETRMAGFELVGDRLLSYFPSRFDPRTSRQALLVNLSKPLATGAPDAWAQNVARLLLDIPLLASSETGECRPGHRARAEWFLSARPGPLGRSETLRSAVEIALEARRRPPGDSEALRRILLPALGELLSRLDGAEALPAEPDEALVARFEGWLPPRSARRRLGELRTVLRRPQSPVSDLRWCLARKEAMAGAALWGLLQSLTGAAPSVATAAWLARFARERQLDVSVPDFLQRGTAQYRRGFAELYPSRAD